LTMADASGLTSYGYDNRDRLVSKTVTHKQRLQLISAIKVEGNQYELSNGKLMRVR